MFLIAIENIKISLEIKIPMRLRIRNIPLNCRMSSKCIFGDLRNIRETRIH